MAYGDRREYPAIELFFLAGPNKKTDWRYSATTTWARTCKEAKERYLAWHGNLKPDQVRARKA